MSGPFPKVVVGSAVCGTGVVGESQYLGWAQTAEGDVDEEVPEEGEGRVRETDCVPVKESGWGVLLD